MSQKLRITIVVTVLLVAFGYFMYSSFNQSVSYYLTVDEILAEAKQDPIKGNNFKVSGKLVGDSVKWDPKKIELRFDVKSEKNNQMLHVLYKGVKPDNFNDGIDVIVEGKYTVESVFMADKVMTKCPSKYEEQKMEEEKNNK